MSKDSCLIHMLQIIDLKMEVELKVPTPQGHIPRSRILGHRIYAYSTLSVIVRKLLKAFLPVYNSSMYESSSFPMSLSMCY